MGRKEVGKRDAAPDDQRPGKGARKLRPRAQGGKAGLQLENARGDPACGFRGKTADLRGGQHRQAVARAPEQNRCGEHANRGHRSDDAGAGESAGVKAAGGDEEQRDRKQDGGCGDVEGAFDGIHADLHGDWRVCAAGDEVGAGEVSDAAKERHRGKTDELRSDQVAASGHLRSAARGTHQKSPAIRADNKAQMDREQA